MATAAARVDVLIFGGGAAGLWILDELCHRGHSAILVERRALGDGQTIASQGIIHGGVKYTLTGSLTSSARAIREMPQVWRECLEARRRPTLQDTRVLSPCCYLWRTDSLKSKLGMVGARVGLRSSLSRVTPGEVPDALRRVCGDVFRVDEQVIDVVSLLADLRAHHGDRLLCAGDDPPAEFSTRARRGAVAVTLSDNQSGSSIEIEPGYLVLAAGAGNQALREKLGLPAEAMQRRPLHMVLARGDLPPLYGHCVDGARTRVTVTSVVDRAGRTVWQIGGQIAEDGVRMSALALVAHAKEELAAVLPGVDLGHAEWAAYRVDRAEGRTTTGLRPEGPSVHVNRNVVTAWPTKLALVPELARLVADRVGSASGVDFDAAAVFSGWPRPDVARPPWEVVPQWQG